MLVIGCKLPHGYVLEIGLSKGGVPTKNYKSVVLNGTLNATANAKFGVVKVDEALWAAWLKQNRTLRYVVDGSIFVAS